MRTIVIAAATALTINASCVTAAGLDDVRDIDIVRVTAATGQVHLYLVLDPAHSPESPGILAKVRRKLDAYRYYVTSGQVWKNEQGANKQLPVVLTVLVVRPLSPESEAALRSLKSTYESSRTAYAYEYMPMPAETHR